MRKPAILLVAILLPLSLLAQNDNNDKVTFTGSIQSDVLFPQEDQNIGAEK